MQIPKSTRMQDVRYDVRGPALVEAEKLMAAGQDVLLLNTGNPAAFGFTAPDVIIRAVEENTRNALPYAQSKGVLAAREAIAAHYRACGMEVGPEDVYTGNGVSEMITMSLQALLNHGDEILIPSPDYPLWTAAAVMSGANVVHYICDEAADWLPDPADIRRKVTSRTRAIVLINPNNPTGAVYPPALLKEIGAIAREEGLLVFSDEIYATLLYDGLEFVSIASLLPDVFCITMCGLSKSHNLTGYRAGWMVLSGDRSGAEGFIEGLNVLASMRLCSNTLAQYTIPAALEHWNDCTPQLQPGGRLYEQRTCIYEALNSIPGVSAVMPKAAFYIFPKLDVRFQIHDDGRFVVDFLKQQHILVVSGSGFNWGQPDHFRVVFLPELAQLQTVTGRLGSFLQGYSQR